MATDDFFRARLDQMIDMRHPLAVLATRMPWARIEASVAPLFAHRARPGRVVADADLFGTSAELVGAGVSNAGRPRLPIRLMVARGHRQLGVSRRAAATGGVRHLPVAGPLRDPGLSAPTEL